MADAPKVFRSAEECVGNTPLIQLNSLPSSLGIHAHVLAKCEFFNPGGSVKDRIGVRMVRDAESSKRIQKQDVLIEPTSGNTGIGIALASALRGYKAIITLPDKMVRHISRGGDMNTIQKCMVWYAVQGTKKPNNNPKKNTQSQEKVGILQALGADIIRTPTEAAFDSPDSHIGVAKRMKHDIGARAHILDQYVNPSNPLAHEEGTGFEIFKQVQSIHKQVDVFVATAGTGGTITGVARALKKMNPRCIIVGVDPRGSILAEPDSLNDKMRNESYKVEGIGYDFIPDNLDRKLIDKWIKCEDDESFIMARAIIRQEGLLVGGSSGCAMVGVMQALVKEYPHLNTPQTTCVVLFADSVRNYMTKFIRDKWMADNGFTISRDQLARTLHDEWTIENRGLLLTTLKRNPNVNPGWKCSSVFTGKAQKIRGSTRIRAALAEMQQKSSNDKAPFLVVEEEEGKKSKVIGITTEANILQILAYQLFTMDDALVAMSAFFPKYQILNRNESTIKDACRVLENKMFALLQDTEIVITHTSVLRVLLSAEQPLGESRHRRSGGSAL